MWERQWGGDRDKEGRWSPIGYGPSFPPSAGHPGKSFWEETRLGYRKAHTSCSRCRGQRLEYREAGLGVDVRLLCVGHSSCSDGAVDPVLPQRQYLGPVLTCVASPSTGWRS